VGGTIYCVHSGISPSIPTKEPCLEILQNLDRRLDALDVTEIPVLDMLWSDPEELEGWGLVPKGVGYLFGADVTREFPTSHGTARIQPEFK